MPQAKRSLPRAPDPVNDNELEALAPNPDEAIALMEAIDPTGVFTITAFEGNIPVASITGPLTQFKNKFKKFILQHNTQRLKRSIYYSVNEPRKDFTGLKARTSDLVSCRVVHADIDVKAGDHERRAQTQSLVNSLKAGEGLPEASAIVRTGDTGGCHIYFFLREKMTCTKEALGKIKGYNRLLATKVSGDDTIDPARILRLPGTINWPTEQKATSGRKPYLAELIHLSEVRYDLGTFASELKGTAEVRDESELAPVSTGHLGLTERA